MKIKELKTKTTKEVSSEKLSEESIKKYLKEMEFWGLDEHNRLISNFELNDFNEALALVNKIGELAESEQHHPDLSIYDYKNVLVTFFTHDADGLTEKDFAMAAKIEDMFETVA